MGRTQLPHYRTQWRAATGSIYSPRLSSELAADLFLIGPSEGTGGVRAQITELVQLLDAVAVCVVDVGGDILARGNEPGLLSPLADAYVLAAVQELTVPAEVVVAGAGLDGELSESDVIATIDAIGGREFGRVDSRWIDDVTPIFDWHPSEVSGLLCAASRGVRGKIRIRGTGLPVEMTDQSAKLWSVAATQAHQQNTVAQALRNAPSLELASERVRSVVGRSELDIEVDKARSTQRATTSAVPAASLAQHARQDRVEYLTVRYLIEAAGLKTPAELDDSLADAGLERAYPPLIRVSAAGQTGRTT